MAKLVFFGTHGSENPTKAAMPFLMANGAAEGGIAAEILLYGDAAVLMKSAVADSVVPVGWAPLRELLATTIKNKVPIFV
ncbi:MAG: hypothetical protein HYX97_06990 [Chloroflexi bacterium]|nr:hypothetical protein [Chloroflexota bacterium]